MEESGRSSFDGRSVLLSEKVCFICRYASKEFDDSGYRKHGYYLYLVDLSSKLGDSHRDDGSSSSVIGFGDFSKLKPNFKIQFDHGMSVCALGSTLYFTDTFYTMGYGTGEIPHPKVYSLDIQTLNQNQFELGAADFCTLPCMWGTKSWPLITSVPGTKKILVFSSRFDVHDSFPSYTHHDDFEMYDVETNSWEKLPQFLLRANKNRPGYFLHLSHVDDEREKGISVPPGPRYYLDGQFARYNIYRYTFINGNGGAVFLVQLSSCDVKLTLDLNSPSKGWQLYNQHKKVHTSIPYTYPFRIRYVDGIFDNVSFPQSSFDKDDDPVKHQSWTATALDDENHVCIVQGAVSRGLKHGRVIMDVVSRVAEAENPTPLASCRFVVEEKLKRFDPIYMFVYPNQPK